MFNRGHRAFMLALVSLSLLGITGAVRASGTIPLSMTQQLDQYGVPLSGCQLYTIQAGTTSTPQNSYKDTALSQTQPNPLVCDASGRLPQFFLADGQIKIRLLDKLGNQQVVLDNILVIGPTSGGGSGATIDPTTIAATGDLKQSYGAQVLTGWVRFNGRTIGSATSGATERANADTQALFLYLWAVDPNLTVSGGRTTAAADFAANKTITLPDGRGRGLTGLDDMGNSAAGRLTSTYFGSSGSCSGVVGTLLGAACGSENRTVLVTNLPPYAPAGSIANGAITSAITVPNGHSIRVQDNSAGGGSDFGTGGHALLGINDPSIVISNSQATSNFTGTAQGGTSTPFPVIQPIILVTIYIKL